MLPPPLHKGKNIIVLKMPRSRQFHSIMKQNKRIETQPQPLKTINYPTPTQASRSTKSYSTIYHDYKIKTIIHHDHRNKYSKLRNSANISNNLSKRYNQTNSCYESLSTQRKRDYSNLPKIQENIISKSLKKSNIQLKLPKENELKREKKKSSIKMATIQQIVERLQKKYNTQNCEQSKPNQVIRIKIKPKPKPKPRQQKSFLSLDVKLDGFKKKKKRVRYDSFLEKQKKKEILLENFDVNGWTGDNKSERALNLSKQNFF